jgi:AAA family ATPase
MLDPALLRPGRIDRKIYVSPPDEEARRQIIEAEINKVPCQDEVLLKATKDELVMTTQGFSGAEVVAIFSEAALLAVEQQCEVLMLTHIREAIAATVPQITSDMIAFYETFAKSVKR